MKISLACSLAFAAFVTACTGGSDEPPTDASVADASPFDGAQPDAPTGTMASVVPCPGGDTGADIWYYDGIGYMPATTVIPFGGVIRFHDLGAHTADHVQGLWSASGDADYCVRFDGLGTFSFRCYFHSGEQGTITVR